MENEQNINNEQDTTVTIDEEKRNKRRKKSKKKNKEKISMFSEIESYGFHYSFKEFIFRLLLMYAIVGVAAYFYSLKIVPIIILAIIFTILTPTMVKAQYRYKYEYNKFDDVSNYLPQLATSFMKTKKIRESLEEVATILNGKRIYNNIMDAIDYIDNAHSDTLFEDAFALIESEYGCEKMTALHNYLIKVEKEGGEFESTLSLMMSDNQEWIQRTSIYQGRRKSTHMAILIALVMSIVMCGVLNMFIPKNIEFINNNNETGYISLAISGNIIYQIVSTIFLSLMIGVYTLTQTVMQGSWLKDKGVRKDKEIIKDYQYYKYFDLKTETIKYSIWFVVFAGVAAVTYFILHQTIFAIIFAVTAIYYLTMPKRKLRHTKKRLERDLEKAFPDWVRDVSISLNTQTVQNAVILSEEKVPLVLKPAVIQLIEEFTEDPVSFEPWNHFLEDFDLPEAKAAARTFYSINELSGDTAKMQINALIKRNARLVQEADEKKADDEISTLGYMVMVPMVISIGKLVVDFFLLILSFMGATNVIGQMF